MTKAVPHCIHFLMRNILNMILIAIFLFSGVSGLPACYATNLDCGKKNTSSCPFSSNTAYTEADELPPCHLLLQESEKNPTEASFPLEQYKRLKIEQILHSPTELPPFILTFSTTFILAANDIAPAQHHTAGEIRNPHYHPPPLFIQHQSFLI